MTTITLTDDVLVCIFKILAPIYTTVKDDWKNKLTLLSVCLQWRNVALPLVYNRIFISSDYTSKIKSNASLVSALNNMGFVKVLDITIDVLTPMPDIQPALDYLSKIAPVWPRIQTLVLYIDHRTRRYVIGKRQLSSLKSAIGISVNFLAKLLPNIVNLQFTGHLPDKQSTWLLQKISKKYANQVKKINSEYPTAVAGQHYFTGLTHLNTEFKVSGFKYSKPSYQFNVCVDSMEYLVMRKIPMLFDWSGFSKHTNPSVVSFPRLKALTVDFINKDTYRYRSRYTLPESPQLHFPQLKHLNLGPFRDRYYALKNGIFDCVLDHMHLSGTDTSLSNIITIDLPETKSISLDISHTWSTSVVNVVGMIHKIAAKAGYIRHIKLKIPRPANSNIPRELHSDYITHLIIYAHLNTAEIVNIINGLPNLIELDIKSYKLYNTLDEYCDSSGEHELAGNTKLEILKFKYRQYYCNEGDAVQFLIYMIIRLQNLKALVAEDIPSKDIAEFVEQCNVCYPHLSSINFKLKS